MKIPKPIAANSRPDLWSFWSVYSWLLQELLVSPIEKNERTRERIHVLPGGFSFGLDLSDGLMPTPGLRKVFPRVAAAEIAWYVSGEQDTTWMTTQAPIWDKFVEPLEREGVDSRGFPTIEPFLGVKSAYGYRWRHHFKRDQLNEAISALHRDPTNRRVVVSAWDPAEDGLLAQGQKNVPCPVMFTLSITDNRLNSTMLLRSSDVFVGLPYDVLGHALLMDAIAYELGVNLGIAQFSLAHAHLYEAHWAMAREALTQAPLVPAQPLPGWKLSEIGLARDAYVSSVKRGSEKLDWPSYSPRPEVIV